MAVSVITRELLEGRQASALPLHAFFVADGLQECAEPACSIRSIARTARAVWMRSI